MNLFHGTPIAVVILVLKNKRNGNSDNILFIDASKYFSVEGTMNVITEDDIEDAAADGFEWVDIT